MLCTTKLNYGCRENRFKKKMSDFAEVAAVISQATGSKPKHPEALTIAYDKHVE